MSEISQSAQAYFELCRAGALNYAHRNNPRLVAAARLGVSALRDDTHQELASTGIPLNADKEPNAI